MERTGRCLCGAVSYVARDCEPKMAACHCDMCRRWTSGPFLSVGSSEVSWQGEEKIGTYQSSEWAERGFCSVCGSALFYRVTAPGPHHGRTHLAFGSLDDQGEIRMTLEYFIDRKPVGYAFSGDRRQLTEAEVFALLSGSSD